MKFAHSQFHVMGIEKFFNLRNFATGVKKSSTKKAKLKADNTGKGNLLTIMHSESVKSPELLREEFKGDPISKLDDRRYVLGYELGDVSKEEFTSVISADPRERKIETIERAWAVKKIKERAFVRGRLIEYYRSTRNAMEELQKTDDRLFQGATENSNEFFLYNKRMRIPTHPKEEIS